MTNKPADDLLAQLNGNAKDEMPPMVDAAPPAALSRDEELSGVLPAAASPVAAADAVYATKAGGAGYRVAVKGEYRAHIPGDKAKTVKPYEAVFNLPELRGALSVIKNKLLDNFLKKKHSDFASVRTQEIVSATPLDPRTPAPDSLLYMDFDALKAYTLQAKAPIDPSQYHDVAHLRAALIDWKQTPKGFEKREAQRQVERKEDAALAAMNP